MTKIKRKFSLFKVIPVSKIESNSELSMYMLLDNNLIEIYEPYTSPDVGVHKTMLHYSPNPMSLSPTVIDEDFDTFSEGQIKEIELEIPEVIYLDAYNVKTDSIETISVRSSAISSIFFGPWVPPNNIWKGSREEFLSKYPEDALALINTKNRRYVSAYLDVDEYMPSLREEIILTSTN